MAKREDGNRTLVRNTDTNLGFKAQVWQAVDDRRSSTDAAEYKHAVLRSIFPKYTSEAFEEHHAKLESESGLGADPEDPDEYHATDIFWIPLETCWAYLKAQAKRPTIGQIVEEAITALKRDNPTLGSALLRDYTRPEMDKMRLGRLIELINNIRVGDEDTHTKDVLGHVYECFLSQFVSAKGNKSGKFCNPRCVLKPLAEMLESYRGLVCNPCCYPTDIHVQSLAFILAHASSNGNFSTTLRTGSGRAKADVSI